MVEYGKVSSPTTVSKVKQYDDPISPAGEMKLFNDGFKLIEDQVIPINPATQVQRTRPSYDTSGTTIIRTYAVVDRVLTGYGKVVTGDVVDIRIYQALPDAVDEAWLVANGYKLIEDGPESFDPVTQTKSTTPDYDTSGATIIRTYAVTDKSLADAKTSKKDAIRSDAKTAIVGNFPDWVQRNCSLGIYGSDVSDPMTTYIGNMIIHSNIKEDEVDECGDVAAVRAVTPDWPTS